MIFLIKILDLIFSTKMYYFLRLEEIIEIIEEKDYALGIKLINDFYDEIEKLGYGNEFLAELDYYLAELYFKSSNIEKSISSCERAYSLFEIPDFPYRVAWIYYKTLLEPEKAIPYAERAYSIDDEFTPAILMIAEINLILENFEKAEEFLKKATSIEEGIVPLKMLGELFIKKEKFKESIEILNKAIEIKKEDSELHYLLGCAYLRLKDKENAIDCFSRSTFYDDTHIDAYFEIANIYQFASNETDKAIIAYQKILEIDPGNKEASYNLAILFFNIKKNVKHAKKIAFDLLKVDEDDDRVKMLLVDIYIYLFNYMLAMKYLNTLPEDDQSVIYKKAIISFKTGEWKNAEEFFLKLDKPSKDVSKYIQKIALFQEKEVFTIISWKKNDHSMTIGGIKKNGPFIIDTFNISILNKYPDSDLFYSFNKGEININDGFLALSRWICDPVIIMGQDIEELDKLSGEEGFSFCTETVNLRKFFFSYFKDFRSIEKDLIPRPPLERSKKIHSLFLEAIKDIRKSPLLLQQSLKFDYMNKISNLPKGYSSVNIPDQLSLISINTEKNAVMTNPDKEIISFVDSPNYYKNWKVFIVPNEINNDIFSAINHIANKKRKKVYIVYNNRQEFLYLYKTLNECIGERCFGVFSEATDYLCPAKVSEFLQTDHYKEELFYVLNWYKNNPDGNLSFIDPDSFSVFQNLRKVLKLISAQGCSEKEKCPHAESCPYLFSKKVSDDSNLVVIQLESLQNMIENKRLSSGIIVNLSISDHKKFLLKSRRFSLDEIEMLLYIMHLRFIGKTSKVHSDGEKCVLNIEHDIIGIKKVLISFGNHLLSPERSLDFKLLKARFPFIYFSLKDKLGNLYSHLAEAKANNILNDSFSNEILLKLHRLISEESFSGICLNESDNSYNFFTISEYSYQDISSHCEEFIFIENKLDKSEVLTITRNSPSREMLTFYKQKNRVLSKENTNQIPVNIFKPEFKFLYMKNDSTFWDEYLKLSILSSISSDSTISNGTLIFLIKKTLRFHQTISNEKLDNITDNLFKHFPEGIDGNILNELLSKNGNTTNLNLDINLLFKIMAICTIISRIEGKRVLVVANSPIVKYFEWFFRRISYIEVCAIHKGLSIKELESSINILKSDLSRIILCDLPMYKYPPVVKVLNTLNIDNKFSLNAEITGFKNISIHSKDKKSIKIVPDNNFIDIDKDSLLPKKPIIEFENACLKEKPFNIDDIHFLSGISKLSLNISNDLIKNQELEICRLENLTGISEIKSLLKSNINQDLVISDRMLSRLLKKYPFWKNVNAFLIFLINNGLVEIKEYFAGFTKFYPQKGDNPIILEFEKDRDIYFKKQYNTNIIVHFEVSKELTNIRERFVKKLSRRLELLDFLGKSSELSVSGEYNYKLSDILTEISSNKKEFLEDMEFLTSMSVFCYKVEDENILITLLGKLSIAVRNLIRKREISFKLLNHLSKIATDDKLNSFHLYKNYFLDEYSELEFEETFFELHYENMISAFFMSPFLSSGYSLYIKNYKISTEKLTALIKKKKELISFLRNIDIKDNE